MYDLITKNHESGQIMQSMPGSEEKMPDRTYAELRLCNVRSQRPELLPFHQFESESPKVPRSSCYWNEHIEGGK
jgi:hypothetical protein